MSLVVATEPMPLSADTDGVVRISGTRVTLDTIVDAYRDGATAEAIAEQYPSLSLANVYTAVGYYLRHQADVDAYLQERLHQTAQIREENETRFPAEGIRARLLMRRNPQG